MIEELYRRYQKELTAWCGKMAMDSSLADDLVQETFLRALMNVELLGSLRENQRRAWLYRTAKNLFIDRVRHGSYEQVQEELPEPVQTEDAYGDVDMEQLLEQLPEQEGVLFAMRYFQGYNSRELGQMFGLPEGTVRSKLLLARKHLRKLLECV